MKVTYAVPHHMPCLHDALSRPQACAYTGTALTTRLRCSCARMALSPPSCPTLLKSNQDSKSERLPKMSGSRKFSRLQSSLRLFCSGVPAPQAQQPDHARALANRSALSWV